MFITETTFRPTISALCLIFGNYFEYWNIKNALLNMESKYKEVLSEEIKVWPLATYIMFRFIPV